MPDHVAEPDDTERDMTGDRAAPGLGDPSDPTYDPRWADSGIDDVGGAVVAGALALVAAAAVVARLLFRRRRS